MPYQVDKIDPSKTVMIVVDMQNDFVAEGAMLRSAQAAAMVPKLAQTRSWRTFFRQNHAGSGVRLSASSSSFAVDLSVTLLTLSSASRLRVSLPTAISSDFTMTRAS